MYFRKPNLGVSPGPTHTVGLMRQGNATPVLLIDGNAPNSGTVAWTVPQSQTPAADYLIRVTRNHASGLSDVSNAPFTITAPISVKASISAILAAYHLVPGDAIRVDAGHLQPQHEPGPQRGC